MRRPEREPVRPILSRWGFGAVIVALLVTGMACASRPLSPAAPASEAVVETGPLSSDLGNADGLRTVHFAYRSTELSPEDEEILRQDAEILKGEKHILVQLEGHCDQRGSVALNLKIGEKRAETVRRGLLAKGVSASSLATISYGKDEPLDSGTSEQAWRKNRRVNFLILSR